MFQTFLTQRALEGKLDTQRALQGHSGTQGTWALEVHLVTWALKALGHLGSQTFGYSGTLRALGHSKHFI